MTSDMSLVIPRALSRRAQKLGHPVRLSNFVVEENRSSWHPPQVKVPRRFSRSKALVNGGSVALSRSTAYWAGVRSLCHSVSLCETSENWPLVGQASGFENA